MQKKTTKSVPQNLGTEIRNHLLLIFPIFLLGMGCSSSSTLVPSLGSRGESPHKKEEDDLAPKAEDPRRAKTEKNIELNQDGTMTASEAPPERSEAPINSAPKVDTSGIKRLTAISDEKILEKFPRSEEQYTILCNATPTLVNVVRQKFCVDKVRPKSLIELQQALGLAVTNPALTGRNQNGTGGNPAFAFQGHSSSVVGSFVSSINPRAVIMTPALLGNNTANPDFVVMGFVRGEQLVELIANDRATGKLEFYLFSFRQACNSAPAGCQPQDLLTPSVESNWTETAVYRAEELANTIVDCFHCHRPAGTQPMLRMQELRNPWTHWFRDNTDGNQLINDYYAAHPRTETYAGIPGPMIAGSDPQKLENLVRGNGFAAQPNEFPTATIRTELAQPGNSGVSPTWAALNDNVKKGLFIPVPFPDLKVTEPSLLAKFTAQYQAFMAGTPLSTPFEDHRNVLLVDPVKRAQMGFAIEPGMEKDPEKVKEMFNLACTQCHNSNLDQTLSRAKFNVDLAKMEDPYEEINVAIERLKLGYSPARLKREKIAFVGRGDVDVELHKGEHILTMPPRRMKVLTDSQIDAMVAYLLEQQKPFTPVAAPDKQ